MSKKMSKKQGIVLKKKFGQHFLQDEFFIDQMIRQINFDGTNNVFEIGCGEGVLTKNILQQDISKLFVFEIDEQWADLVENKFKSDDRFSMFRTDILQADLSVLQNGPWVLLANLPYNITFPILQKIYQHKHMISEGVIMIQEEVAQKIMKTSGRGYGYPSLFYQHYFEWKLLDKVPPQAFYPPPKVFSRLLYFKTRSEYEVIPQEVDFWKFIKVCFHQPRRTMRNNLMQSHYDIALFEEAILKKRAQELSMSDFLHLWKLIIG